MEIKDRVKFHFNTFQLFSTCWKVTAWMNWNGTSPCPEQILTLRISLARSAGVTVLPSDVLKLQMDGLKPAPPIELARPAKPTELARPSLEDDLPMRLFWPWLDENTSGPDADEDRLMFEPDPGAIERFGIELIIL